MPIDIHTVGQLIVGGNPNVERFQRAKAGSNFLKAIAWTIPPFDRLKRSSLRSLLQAIGNYNANETEVNRAAIASELYALPFAKRNVRYHALAHWLENHEELRATMRVESGRQRLEVNDYRVTAGLADYRSYFGDGFSRVLSELGNGDVWIDAGAGEAVAMRQYITDRGSRLRATCVAVGYAKPDSVELMRFEQTADRFRYVSGKYFSAMTDRELGVDAGNVALITDYNGVLFYTTTLTDDVNRYLDLLRHDGMAFFGFYADIFRGDERVPVADWLDEVAGAAFQRVLSMSGEHFELTRGTGVVHVPPLEFVAVESDLTQSPPKRVFRLGVL